jgi:hypothetical protein
MNLLTASRMKAFRACARQHHYAYVLGRRPLTESAALSFGTVMHAALEAWWSTGPAGALELALQHLPENLDPYTRARAEAMLFGYDVAWGDKGFEALAIEKEFKLPLINPDTGARSRTWELAGKIDVIARGPDGRVWVIEHKTSSEDIGLGGAYRARLTLDGQVSQYIEGTHALGYDVAGVIYDVLKKPTIAPFEATPEESRKYKKDGTLYAAQRDRDETPEEYRDRCVEKLGAEPEKFFAHIEVVRLEADRDEYAFDVWQLGELMRESERTGRAPRNGDACFRYGSPCAFLAVCQGRDSIDNPYSFRTAGASPELSPTKAA